MRIAPVSYLEPADSAHGHPFAHPSHIASDVNSLRFMIDQLCLFLESPHLYSHSSRPIIFHRPSPEKWLYRLVVADPVHLMQQSSLTFVGFLGQKRSDANIALADEFDQTLVGEIPNHPGLLSYSTMGLVSGDFSNLVIFSNLEAKAHWSRSNAHAKAAGKLSPDYYLSIRLYNGQLSRGIADSHSLQLTQIKYFDYQANPWWQAVRVFEDESADGQT
jgi:hypothetical protein